MKKILVITLSVFALAGLSACNDYSSPKGVVMTAGKALQKSKFKTFKKTLAGKAMADFGNPAGMMTLQTTLSKFEIAALADKLISSTHSKMHDELTYSVEGFGRRLGNTGPAVESLFETAVLCKIDRWIDHECSNMNETTTQFMPGGYYPHPYYPHPGHMYCYPVERESEFCQITDISLR